MRAVISTSVTLRLKTFSYDLSSISAQHYKAKVFCLCVLSLNSRGFMYVINVIYWSVRDTKRSNPLEHNFTYTHYSLRIVLFKWVNDVFVFRTKFIK